MKESRKRKLNRVLNFYIGIGIVFWVLAAVLILTPILPAIVYEVYPQASANEVDSLTSNLEEDEDRLVQIREKYSDDPPEEPPEEESNVNKLPPFDPSLPNENRLIIKKIGVNAKIQEGENSDKALQRGPWRVSDFGLPTYQDAEYFPMIIASHRWGAIGWSSEERKNKSFYKLPNLEVGDRVEIIWNKRKYIYEIYKAEESTQITDYESDLILYTCKLIWDSPVRIFRYADRVYEEDTI
jgi:sortase (surface protein transpeptidase)